MACKNGVRVFKIMPREIELEDGSKQTVYTKEELAGYKQGAEKNKERKEALSKLEKELGVEEGQKLEDRINELKENANPNFGKYRRKLSALEKFAKEKGVNVDEEGNVISGSQPISAERIQQMIDEGTKKALSTTAKEQQLARYKEEDRKVVEHYLDKLMATGGNLEENLALAEAKAFEGKEVDIVKLANSNLSGLAPRRTEGGEKKFTDTEEGKKLLEQLVPQLKNKK